MKFTDPSECFPGDPPLTISFLLEVEESSGIVIDQVDILGITPNGNVADSHEVEVADGNPRVRRTWGPVKAPIEVPLAPIAGAESPRLRDVDDGVPARLGWCSASSAANRAVRLRVYGFAGMTETNGSGWPERISDFVGAVASGTVVHHANSGVNESILHGF